MEKIIKRLKFAFDINYWLMNSKQRYEQIYLKNEQTETLELPGR